MIILLVIFIIFCILYLCSYESFTNVKYIDSFDIFDTLLARTVLLPTDIFNIIENNYPYKNFKNIRIQAQNKSNNTMDDIYKQFQIITNDTNDTISKLKDYELKTETQNTIPILSNINKISITFI